ncbi:DUF4265 domain-containing protein [Catenulispora sp. NL8]|uniref:DUF4265 domain-containing protein n=1 Tax=Catenulispora pinistramenti TaxID=2705254 RepID=A0ABS5KKK9_9ACTN|nr:DUF4265 domain-containing protein [Catenulispora pinistramenti]MBS2546426.1 DUF4265 domain-containing protein [Catenulispora pinistramenti]
MSQQPTSASGAKMFKVAFDLDAEKPNWPPVSVERLWGEKTEVKFEIRLLNTPFFARGVAHGDLIQVRPDHERRELVFDHFTSESGHSTTRVVLMDTEAGSEVETRLREAGCSWEKSEQFASLLAVDVPPAVDYRPLREWLRALTADGVIEFQESAISSIHRGQLPNFPKL